MTQADFVEIVSMLFGAYVIGWAKGTLIRVFTQAMEKI